MNRVFVSYSRKNKNFAERIARDLSDAGLDVWVDWRQIHAGELWQNEIFRGIERSDMLVLCLSPDAVASEWVQREVNTARDQKKFIIPVMAVSAMPELNATDNMRWLLNVHFIDFVGRYEAAFPELLKALPGKRRIGAYDVFDPATITNPFKGLEAFQQTDSHFFFGRDRLINRGLKRLRQHERIRSLAVVGASGSGKSSLVRAGIIPKLRDGDIKGSERWHLTIFTPGSNPIERLAERLSPLLPNLETAQITDQLRASTTTLNVLVEEIIEKSTAEGEDEDAKRLILVIDQFEEAFTRASDSDRKQFFELIHHAVIARDGNTQVILTMRADFFDRLSHYPILTDLFEQENMLIATEMNPAELLETIEGPAEAVGLIYEDGLSQRILDDVLSQPGSLPLLQYALKELFQKRDGRNLTHAAYDQIGGVRQALAQHAEDIYNELNAAQQGVMRRILLRLVEISEDGEATRRRVNREDLRFRDVSDEAIQEEIDIMTAPGSRLLITSREIKASDDLTNAPVIWVEVSHEALIRQWDRFRGWVSDNIESLRYGSELLKGAHDWLQGNRDKAYLLTGNRLARAEEWLQDADATTSQREFIEASLAQKRVTDAEEEAQAQRELDLQTRAANRLRNFVIVLIVGLVVAIGLSLYALNRQDVAEDASNRANVALTSAANALSTAERSSGEASSLALAANAARVLADGNGDLALVLAIAAAELDNPPPQSLRTLAEVGYAPGTRLVFDQHNETVSDVDVVDERAISASSNTIILWNTFSGEQIVRFNEEGTVHSELVNAVAIHPNGDFAVSAGNEGLLALWDIDPNSATFGTVIQQINAHTDRVLDIEFNEIGTMLVSASADTTAAIWNMDRLSEDFGTEQFRFSTHEATVNAVATNSNGSRILTGDDNGIAILWDRTGSEFCRFTASANDENTVPVNTLTFNPRRAHVAIGSDDALIRLWNISTCELVTEISEHGTSPINSLHYDTEGTILGSGADDNVVVLYSIDENEVINRFSGHEGSIRALVFNNDDTRAYSASADTTIRVWDMVSAEEEADFIGHINQEDADSPSVGVFNATNTRVLSGSQDGTLRLWDTTSTLAIQLFDAEDGHTDTVTDVALSADETTALSASNDGLVLLWDVATGTILARLEGHGTAVNSVVYMPGSTHALSGGSDGSLIEWDINVESDTFGQEIRRFGEGRNGHTKAVNDIVISPDSIRILTASSDETIILWDIETAQIIQQYDDEKSSILSVAFNPAGDWFVSGPVNGTVVLWNIEDGEVLRRFNGHVGAVSGVAFGPDGNLIITGGQDDSLRVWDVNTGLEVRRYDVETPIQSLDVTDNGRTVLTGLNDASLSTWRILIDINDLIEWVYLNRFVDIPTCNERDLFRLTPCDAENNPPSATPPALPEITPTPFTGLALTVNQQAIINIDTSLRMREAPGTDQLPLLTPAQTEIRLADGEIVTIIDGPVNRTGFTWWQVQRADGQIGWIADAIPEFGIRTLLPLTGD